MKNGLSFRRSFGVLLLLSVSLFNLSACSGSSVTDIKHEHNTAPGAPGKPSVWAYAGKTGIGTAYEAYKNGQYSNNAITGQVSKVWFSIADGIITETMFGMIHQAQIKDMQWLIVGDDFIDTQSLDTTSTISYLHQDAKGRPLSPAYRITSRDKQNKYQIEQDVFTDPDQNSMMVRTRFTAFERGISPYLLVNPHINNNGLGDRAWVNNTGLYAEDSGNFLHIASSQAFSQASAGFVGVSDGLSDLADGRMDWQYTDTGEQRGNVALTAGLAKIPAGKTRQIDLVLGFGYSLAEAKHSSEATLARGYQQVLAHYNGEGDTVGWQDYIDGLNHLPDMAELATDGGALAYASALVLKSQEDKTHAGALIASLSNPWGDTVSADKGATGYKAVWPRDFYQCAMALLALGDTQTPRVAFEYLQQVQVNKDTPDNTGDGGWFLQKTHVNGQLEWVAVQLDQTAMPIMLAWKLWQHQVLSETELKNWYHRMLKPAANFLVNGGNVAVDWNKATVSPLRTQQERWEEQEGYSPSSAAATIAGLVVAADIAKLAGDTVSVDQYLKAADKFSASLEPTMFTTTGGHNHNGQYYLRISQNQDPNDNGPLLDRNGRGELREKDILDGGFLELVRYGVRSAKDRYIVDTLDEFDDTRLPHALRVKYEFSFEGEEGLFPGWRRYGHDGYGEDYKTGANYGENGSDGGQNGGMSPNQRGRVWPFFTGERAHYELAAGTSIHTLRSRYVRAMELFANEGLMLPEQVWDGVGVNPKGKYTVGEGTNGATPLAWTHAEYLKLLRSLSDKQVWDAYEPVIKRYQ